MFNLYHSNQLDILKELMAHFIAKDPLADPFVEEQVLVQSPGMAQWVKMELAKSMGISANITFPLPASFIWKMFQKVLPDIPDKSAFNKEAMSWKLMLILPELLVLPEFESLKHYLADDQDDYRLFQLCQKISDTFDQYLVYRPEWIAGWEAGENIHADTHPWQPLLWRELVAKTEALGQSHYHRANLYDQFIARLNSPNFDAKLLPDRIFVFGVSALPPRYLDALQALGMHTEIHFMLSNPCRLYWGDLIDPKWLLKQRTMVNHHNETLGMSDKVSANDEQTVRALFDEDETFKVGNPLLASMGKLGRDNLALLTEFGCQELDVFVEPTDDGLLASIQRDILDLADRSMAEFNVSQQDANTRDSRYKLPINPADTSLELHSCHSPMREIEVLHNNLLTMFSENPGLNPRDVVIMMPDVNGYSPYIQAVFGAMDRYDERYIPFSISDSGAQYDNPILLSFLQLLALPLSRCNVSELLSLLEVPAVLARFAITPDEFNRLRQWIDESGIRWGIDEDDATRFDLPGMKQNTWLFGLHRMLLGYAYGGDDIYQGILPYQEVQGIEAELLGKLAHFIEALLDSLTSLQDPKSIADWIKLGNTLIDDFYKIDVDDEQSIKMIRDAFSHLDEQLKSASYDKHITPLVLRDYLNNALSQAGASQKFLAGQVNFCTLMPMRSIPFKVICLLGMNDGVYPRSIPPMGFDLMANDHKQGDRSRRDDDRYLFLEALISAQSKLYISYIGSSIRDKSERLPSVLITELLQYCQQSFCITGDEDLSPDESAEQLLMHLIQQHALQPFDARYFDPLAPCSFAKEWLPALAPAEELRQFLTEPLPALISNDDMQEVELAELLRFYRHPTKYFFNRRLKVYFNQASLDVLDDEPFDVDNLEKYHLKAQLLETELMGGDINLVTERLVASGSLPLGRFGQISLDKEVSTVSQLAQVLMPLLTNSNDDLEVDIPLVSGRLVGWLKQIYNGGLVRHKPSGFNGKDYLQVWLEHLCFCISIKNPVATTLVHLTAGKPVVQRLRVIEQPRARELLFQLLEVYNDGCCQPLALFPKTGWSWAKTKCTTAEPDDYKLRSEAVLNFEGGYNRMGENADDYLQRSFPRLNDEVYKLMSASSESVLFPIFEYLEDVE